MIGLEAVQDPLPCRPFDAGPQLLRQRQIVTGMVLPNRDALAMRDQLLQPGLPDRFQHGEPRDRFRTANPHEQAVLDERGKGIDAVGLADPGTDLLDGVISLADEGLLQPLPGFAAEPRFGMLETLREYGRERMTASGEAAADQTFCSTGASYS